MAKIVVPAGMPEPKTAMVALRPAVLATVAVTVPLMTVLSVGTL